MASRLQRASCALCGAPITNRLADWMPCFRALYGVRGSDGPARLSGVGIRDDFDHVPLDPNERYYDNNFQPVSLELIGLLTIGCGREISAPAGVFPNYWGIPFHVSCWEILERVSGDRKIDVPWLCNFLRSFPLQGGRINWGHDYGGYIPYIMPASAYTGDEQLFLNPYYDAEVRTTTSIYQRDPMETYEIQAALRSPGEYQVVRALERRETKSSADPFSRLPHELQDMILFQLPSRDVLHLKLASRSFAEAELDDAFWASRFSPGHEMWHLFEAYDRRQVRLSSWQATFFEARRLEHVMSVRNRRRIWDMAERLVTIMDGAAGSAAACLGSGPPVVPPFLRDMPGVPWLSVAHRNIRSVDDQFEHGCASLWQRYVNGVRRVRAVFVSFVDLPAGRFVSGLRFQIAKSGEEGGEEEEEEHEDEDEDESDLSVGYVHPQNELRIKLPHIDNVGEFDLYGFELAMGSQGIRGIALLNALGEPGEWVGSSEGVPRRLLLFKGNGPVDLCCKFDAVKLVGITASGFKPQPGDVASSESRILRETAIWYPEPPPSLCKLGRMPDGPEFDPARYGPHGPMFQALYFGGRNGENLHRVAGLRIWYGKVKRLVPGRVRPGSMEDCLGVHGIEVYYNEGPEQLDPGLLGSRSQSPENPARSVDPEGNQCIDIPIDGAGGERIEVIEMSRHPTPIIRDSVKVYTSFNNYRPDHNDPKMAELYQLTPRSDGLLIGFFARLCGLKHFEDICTVHIDPEAQLENCAPAIEQQDKRVIDKTVEEPAVDLLGKGLETLTIRDQADERGH